MTIRLLRSFAVTIITVGAPLVAAWGNKTAAQACVAATFVVPWLPDNVRVENVSLVQSGGTYGEGALDLMYPDQPTDLPELCAVTVYVQSSSISAYRFGLFLPTDWNQRFLAIGNGGFGGGINWLDMGPGSKYGFAVVSTDTGHNSTTGDASWAYYNPQKQSDWGWRAMNGSVTIAKGLVEVYYARKAQFSYYNGCSNGGRQGLKQVQIAPDMFDGVIVGAAAWYTTHLNPWMTAAGIANVNETSPNRIDWHLFPVMGDLVISQCDALDGVLDGIISDPDKCVPDYTQMSCDLPGSNVSACLTDAQIETANAIYQDYVSEEGEYLYPGLSPGCEGQVQAIYNQSQTTPFGINYLRFFVTNNPYYNWTEYNATALEYAVETNPGQASVSDWNLTEFRDSGAKMIMYHGQADGLIPPRGSEWYYETVVDTMGGNLSATQEYFRYYQIPGMQHCWNTDIDLQRSPWNFGGEFQATAMQSDAWSVPGFVDPQHDILLAMMRWVENGTAVDSFIATTWEDQLNASSGVRSQRPICHYPQTATWDGVGDVNAASSWSCHGVVERSMMAKQNAMSGFRLN